MTREGIKNKVMAIIADKIGFSASEIKEDTSFKYDLGTDSLVRCYGDSLLDCRHYSEVA